MGTAYDQIAPEFARRNAAMPPELSVAADHFLRSVGSEARILDLGCGPGRDTSWFQTHGVTVIGADLSAGMLDQARRQVDGPLLQMNMQEPGFCDGSFQGVWCNAALLHIPKCDTPRVLAQIRRVLVSGGRLFLSVQLGTGEGWEKWPYGSVERWFARYNQEEMAGLIVDSGFMLETTTSSPAGLRRWLQFFAMSLQ
jgi:ubiquinone/menaquinone biosynthesis C-methylase UbiE